MKKTILILGLITGSLVVSHAQKLDAAKVPAAVKTAFNKMHPGTSVKWEMEKGAYEAGFKKKGKDMSVLFTKEGTMTESEEDIAVSELPTPVVQYVKAHYKGAPIKEAAKIIKADGTVTYEAEVNKTDLIFDDKGVFQKEIKD